METSLNVLARYLADYSSPPINLYHQINKKHSNFKTKVALFFLSLCVKVSCHNFLLLLVELWSLMFEHIRLIWHTELHKKKLKNDINTLTAGYFVNAYFTRQMYVFEKTLFLRAAKPNSCT